MPQKTQEPTRRHALQVFANGDLVRTIARPGLCEGGAASSRFDWPRRAETHWVAAPEICNSKTQGCGTLPWVYR